MVKGPREDQTKGILNVPTIIKIVEVMLARFPLGSDFANEILDNYDTQGYASNEAIEAIVVAIEEEPGLSSYKFTEIADNEPGIIPYYIKKLKEGTEGVRQKIRVAGTERPKQ